jgi:hypothetical protein
MTHPLRTTLSLLLFVVAFSLAADDVVSLRRRLAGERAALSRAEKREQRLLEAHRKAEEALQSELQRLKAEHPTQKNLDALLESPGAADRLCDKDFISESAKANERLTVKEEAAISAVVQQRKAQEYASKRTTYALNIENGAVEDLQRKVQEVSAAIVENSARAANLTKRRSRLIAIAVLLITPAGSGSMTDDERPAAWLSHVTGMALPWHVYAAFSPRGTLRIPQSLAEQGFTKSYKLKDVTVVHHYDHEPLDELRDFSGVIVDKMENLGQAAAALVDSAASVAPTVLCGATLKSTPAAVLQNAKLVSVSEPSSLAEMKDRARVPLVVAADTVLAAPQLFFMFPLRPCCQGDSAVCWVSAGSADGRGAAELLPRKGDSLVLLGPDAEKISRDRQIPAEMVVDYDGNASRVFEFMAARCNAVETDSEFGIAVSLRLGIPVRVPAAAAKLLRLTAGTVVADACTRQSELSSCASALASHELEVFNGVQTAQERFNDLLQKTHTVFSRASLSLPEESKKSS